MVLNMTPLNREGMAAISATEGQKFAGALALVANREGDHQQTREYVLNVLQGADHETMAALEGAGLTEVTTQSLIQLAKHEGRAFRNAVQWLRDHQTERQVRQNAIEYLVGQFEEYGIHFVKTAPVAGRASQPVASPEPVPPVHENPIPPKVQQPVPTKRSAPVPHEPQPATGEGYGDTAKIFGNAAAICFAETTIFKTGKPTITIEAALARKGGGQYDWGSKWTFQLTPAELFLVYGTLMGYGIANLKLDGHGSANEKSLRIQDQGASFYFAMDVKGETSRGVPAPARELALPILLLGRRIMDGNRGLSWEAMNQISMRVCAIHAKPKGAN